MNFLTALFDSFDLKPPNSDEFVNLAERKCRVRFSLETRYTKRAYIYIRLEIQKTYYITILLFIGLLPTASFSRFLGN